MFRRKRQPTESAQEAERRALFAELAKRPDTVCPFLGLAASRTEYRDGVSEQHRCYAFGDPAELSAEQQTKVCLQRGYGNCPRYLRGVLVIPTEELEALRHPQPVPAAAPEPPPAASSGGRRRTGVLAAALVLVLAAGGGVAAFLALENDNGVAVATATPSPAVPSSSAAPSSEGPSGTSEPTPGDTPSPTPVVLGSGGALPTPGPDDTPTGYAVRVEAGTIPVVEMLHDGTITGEATNEFDNRSWAPVERLEADGNYYWRTLQGDYFGRAYSRDLSPKFVIFETFESPSGDPTFRRLKDSEYYP